MHVPKLLKEELGGGNKEFSLTEGGSTRSTSSETPNTDNNNILAGANFVNIEEADRFLTSADRQSILLHFLNSIRAEAGDSLGNLAFREGEAISE